MKKLHLHLACGNPKTQLQGIFQQPKYDVWIVQIPLNYKENYKYLLNLPLLWSS